MYIYSNIPASSLVMLSLVGTAIYIIVKYYSLNNKGK